MREYEPFDYAVFFFILSLCAVYIAWWRLYDHNHKSHHDRSLHQTVCLGRTTPGQTAHRWVTDIREADRPLWITREVNFHCLYCGQKGSFKKRMWRWRAP